MAGENIQYKTNEQYRSELKQIFDSIDENYKLRWFYVFVTEKIKKTS